MANKDVLAYRPHFQRDWLTSGTVQSMSYAAQGQYLRLLDLQWENEHLPGDVSRIRAMLRPTDDEWQQFCGFVDECFPVCEDGNRRNPRLRQTRDDAEAKVAQASSAGKKSAEARQRNANASEPDVQRSFNGRSTDEQPTFNHTNTKRNTNTKGLVTAVSKSLKEGGVGETQNDQPKEPRDAGASPTVEKHVGKQWLDDHWIKFHDAYPKRTGAYDWPRAKKKFAEIFKHRSLAEADGLFDELATGLDAYSKLLDDSGKMGSQFVKQPATWLNAKGWEDEYDIPDRDHSSNSTGREVIR